MSNPLSAPDESPPSNPEANPELAVTASLASPQNATLSEDAASSWQLPQRYRIVGEIGRGGMGVVLRVIDLDLQRPLAVKVMRHIGDSAGEQRLLDECRITGQLQHPGIPPVHETGRLADGRPFFSMKLIDGRTLSELLKQRPSLSPDLPRFLKLFEQLAQTIAYAHSQGVIHRDLKPLNVMVGAFGEVQVMDWGLAKRLPVSARPPNSVHQSDGTRTVLLDSRAEEAETGGPGADTDRDHRTLEGQILGTPAYMAPEQARGELARLDERCDVFALGAILCEILTGKPPYAGRDKQDVFEQSTKAELADAWERLEGSGLDAELLSLTKDCLAGEPESRPRQAGIVAARITGYQASVQDRLQQTLLAQTATDVKTGEVRKRRRLALFLAGTVTALLLGAGSGGLWYANDLARRRQEESQRTTDLAQKQDRLNREVATILDDAERLRKDLQEKLQDPRQAAPFLSELHQWQTLLASAQAAWQRADTLATGNRELLSSDLRHRLEIMGKRLQQDEQDRQLAFELDRVRLESSSLIHGQLSLGKSAQKLAEVLQKAGYDAGESPDLMTARIAKSPIRIPLIVAIDYWALITPDDALRGRLFAVARDVDPDPWRDRFRQMEVWNDVTKLQALADQVDLRQESSLLLTGLAQRLRMTGGKTVGLLRNALVYHPRDFWLSFELGLASTEPAEQVGAFRAALAVRPDAAVAHYNLGVVFQSEQKWEEARACYRRAVELDEDYDGAYNNLGLVLEALQKPEEARACYQQAIKVAPRNPMSYTNLGTWMQARERLDEASTFYRQAIEIDPRHDAAWNNLGTVQRQQEKLEDAAASFRKALAINPRHAMAWCNLGHTLIQNGSFAEGLEALKRGHELGSRQVNWSYPSAKWIHEAEHWIALDEKLPAVLSGEVVVSDAKEQFALGEICVRHKKRFAAAANFFKAAFAGDARLSLTANARYNAACAAALAAAGKGIDATDLTADEKTNLCRESRAWLQAELDQCRQQLAGQDPVQYALARVLLQHAAVDPDLAPFRNRDFLTRLPAADQSAWQQFWRDAEDLLKGK